MAVLLTRIRTRESVGGRILGAVVIGHADHIQDLGVVQAMIPRGTDVSAGATCPTGERLSYNMLAYESAKR